MVAVTHYGHRGQPSRRALAALPASGRDPAGADTPASTADVRIGLMPACAPALLDRASHRERRPTDYAPGPCLVAPSCLSTVSTAGQKARPAEWAGGTFPRSSMFDGMDAPCTGCQLQRTYLLKLWMTTSLAQIVPAAHGRLATERAWTMPLTQARGSTHFPAHRAGPYVVTRGDPGKVWLKSDSIAPGPRRT